MELPRLVIGQTVRGRDLWDREKEINNIWKALETGSVMLTAPRRFGKTSIMLNLVDKPKENWEAFYLDVEWVRGPEDFVAEIMTALLDKYRTSEFLANVKKIAGKAVDRIEEIEVAKFKIALRDSLKEDWQDQGKALIKLLKGTDGKNILIVDELPLLVLRICKNKSKSQAEDFLFWLRGLRHIPELQDKVRWVIGGSIGMEKVLGQVGAGTKAINDLNSIRIGEFSDKDAKNFIKALIKKETGIQEISPSLLEKYLQILGPPIPYFIQILVRESINEMENRKQKNLSPEIIEEAYNEEVLAAYNRTYFEHYYERIKEYFDEGTADIAKNFLTVLSRQDYLSRKELWNIYKQETKGKGKEEAFNYLLAELENDFYITFDSKKEKYTFATKILKDWWRKYHAI